MAGSRAWKVVGAWTAAGLLSIARPAGGAGPSVDDCLACHADRVEAASGRAVEAIDRRSFDRSTHADVACTTCHTDARDVPHAVPLSPVGLEPCAECHTAVDDYRTSVHGASRAAGATGPAGCADCHGDAHEVRASDDPASPVHRLRVADTCARCHADRTLVERFHIPIVRPVEAYLESAHARMGANHEPGAVCSDCHGTHTIARGSDPSSSIHPTKIPATCGRCHAEIQKAYDASIHGEALARGARGAPSCTDCHGEHRILGAGERASPVFAANLPGETCGRCHGDERLSEKYGIGVGKVTSFEDSYHGLALRAGKVTVASCASCHGVHDIRPSRDPRSHVHPANLADTCGSCHPGAGTTFDLGPVHGAPDTTKARAVGWVRFLYLWLIGLTIGGMSLHNLLDLVRKARSPLPPAPPLPDAPERMSRALRWQHRLVMVSFPMLAYTGFALTYPDHWWAVPLVHFENVIELRALLHRGAAVVLLAALLWHGAHVARRPRLRACFRHIIPSRDDVRVLRETLAYHLGRRPHPPRVDTFHYAEKAEYWAFLWGTALMTVTGVLLWFEDVTLGALPGWVPDVATAIHFYEAVLATLAILVWHFYFVIFDPAVYPMDWTWWTGESPPHRQHERRSEPRQD